MYVAYSIYIRPPINATMTLKEYLMQWPDRLSNYVKETKFPRSIFPSADGRVVGTWIMGNDYRVKTGYYGGYPAGYLRRVRALFPEKRRVLHIFSGRVDLAALPDWHTGCIV
jgi:hypothetical protein